MNGRDFENALLDATGLRGKGVRAMTFHFEVGKTPLLTVQLNKRQTAEDGLGELFEQYFLTLTKKTGEEKAA
jgi:hypothetical protein